MSRRASVLTLLPVLLLIGACGSSTKSSGSASASTTATTSTAATSQTATTTTSSNPGPTTVTSPSGGSVRSTTHTTTGSSGGGSTTARVPATFTVGQGGRLTPPFVSSPAFLAVQLTVGSGDGMAHRVTLRVPELYVLYVPAHGRTTLLLRGLRAGRYGIDVDGTPRGALMIGGEPGP